MNRERFKPLGIVEEHPESAALAAVIGFIVLSLVTLRAVKEPDHTQKTDPNSQPVGEKVLAGDSKSIQEYNEQVVEPKSIEQILSYMQGRKEQEVLSLARELGRFYESGGIYVAERQTPEEIDLTKAEGRLPGTFMVWGKSTLGQPGLRMEIPSDELNDSRKSIADWVIIFAANLNFVKSTEHASSIEEMIKIRDEVYLETPRKLLPLLAQDARYFKLEQDSCFDADAQCVPISQ